MIEYSKISDGFKSHDPYELMLIPPNKKAEMIIWEIKIKSGVPNLNLVRDLITLGAYVDWQDELGWTLLHMTVSFNSPKIAQVLIGAGADVNVQDDEGMTPLHWAVSYNRPDIARMLIDANANLDIQSNSGRTALHWTSYLNEIQITQMLVDAGARKDIRNNQGKLPYELAETDEMRTILRIL